MGVEVGATRGGDLCTDEDRGPIMVVCWWTTSDIDTRGVLLLVLGALGLRKGPGRDHRGARTRAGMAAAAWVQAAVRG
jgi:hypothetical protein